MASGKALALDVRAGEIPSGLHIITIAFLQTPPLAMLKTGGAPLGDAYSSEEQMIMLEIAKIVYSLLPQTSTIPHIKAAASPAKARGSTVKTAF